MPDLVGLTHPLLRLNVILSRPGSRGGSVVWFQAASLPALTAA